MVPRLSLTEKEATLQHLLLDVSQYIHETEQVAKPQLRFTGGWVRDKLLGVESKDIDVGIDSMTGLKFGLGMKRFLADENRTAKYDQSIVRRIAKIEANPEKSKHLETATTNVLGLDIDLVNLRKETYTQESRNPQIEPATPEEDALRRDSTVNALFYNLQTEEVEDFTGRGLQDLELNIIRTPLDPFQTFEDDPLRVLRCIRFASRLGYSIDPAALKCMGDKRITDALKIKISRERVGIEVEKMLRGPDPRMALKLIEGQDLYDTIFSDPQNPEVLPDKKAGTEWRFSIHFLGRLLQGSEFEMLRILLIQCNEDLYYAWLLVAFLPWQSKPWPLKSKRTSKGKGANSAAAVIAREGLKLDNKAMEIVQSAVDHYEEIRAMVFDSRVSSPDKLSPEEAADLREQYGMAIRQWGLHWRNIVIYALLRTNTRDSSKPSVTDTFSAWLSRLEELGVLDAYAMKPLVDGHELSQAMDNRRPGPWLSKALELVLRWQLRNPESDDKDLVIKEVKAQLE